MTVPTSSQDARAQSADRRALAAFSSRRRVHRLEPNGPVWSESIEEKAG
jgi:hypothetical protein